MALVVALMSVVLMTLSAAAGAMAANALVAALTALVFAVMAFLNGRLASQRAHGGRDSLAAASEVARLVAVFSAWAGLAMAAMYYLTLLSWYHAYQYAFAFLLIAIAAYAISRYLRKGLSRVPDSNWVKAIVFLTVAQGAAAGAGIVFLLVAGKVGTARADWAANNIFLAAAVGILLMSLAGLPGLIRATRLS
ncbi:MAG: hypothetical protein V3V97_09720 [Hyphomicrobiaceae bacterium]